MPSRVGRDRVIARAQQAVRLSAARAGARTGRSPRRRSAPRGRRARARPRCAIILPLPHSARSKSAAAAAVCAFAPGRVNLIGEHTDYNDGLALPFALRAGVLVQARASGRDEIEARALDLGEHDRFALGATEPTTGWRAFARGAVAELRASGFPVCGAELEISGDLPRGGGLSSSAALAVALCLALIELGGGAQPDAVAMARICSRIEHVWVGALTGLLDQLASLCGRERHAVLIDFATLELEHVPLELAGHRLVVLDSGERHAHGASGYNERRRECARACELLGVRTLREASGERAERLPEPLRRRARHVLSENQRVRAAVAALRAGDLHALGALLNDSHASLRDDYEVSSAAVEAAVARLRKSGALGARLIGGGFGGSVIGLLPPDAAPPAGALEVSPGPGARVSRLA
jgi:galactokinase